MYTDSRLARCSLLLFKFPRSWESVRPLKTALRPFKTSSDEFLSEFPICLYLRLNLPRMIFGFADFLLSYILTDNGCTNITNKLSRLINNLTVSYQVLCWLGHLVNSVYLNVQNILFSSRVSRQMYVNNLFPGSWTVYIRCEALLLLTWVSPKLYLTLKFLAKSHLTSMF